MEKILYPSHPCRCIITGPSNSGDLFFIKYNFKYY